jgi:membrane protein implicated in regulation of membrane protease activity
MVDSTVWWVLAGMIVAFELITGTFYLLMLSFGFMAAAVAAQLGASVTGQLVAASIFGGGAVILWRRYKRIQPTAPLANANRDVNMDVGETVRVTEWQSDGTSTVKYRGSNWSVAVLDESEPTPGSYRIVEVIGSRLMLKRL